MDLAITFHIGGMKRTATNPPHELIDFFPDLSWRKEYESAKNQGKRAGNTLLNAYKRGLANIGYQYVRDGVLEKNSKNVPLYHLIFASKHPRGSEFWDKVTTRQITGQIRMQFENYNC
jgi:three-Cys-motif partner protein